MPHLDPVSRKVRSVEVSDPPPPWRRTASIPTDGLSEAGFDDDSELLLVISQHGREIIDCAAGQVVDRDAIEDDKGWYGRDILTGIGFGPLDGKQVRLCGQYGGGLPVCTRDGWAVEALAIDWPDHSLLLIDPASSLYQPHARFWKIDVVSDLRAFGFSYTGKTLLIATPNGVTFFGRG